MLSGWSLCHTTFRSIPQRCANSRRCAVVIAWVFLNSRIQLFLWRASATVHCLFLDNLYKFSAMSLGRHPWIHPDCQNFAFLPSPSVIVVQAAKRSRSETKHVGRSQPTPFPERPTRAKASEAAVLSRSCPN